MNTTTVSVPGGSCEPFSRVRVTKRLLASVNMVRENALVQSVYFTKNAHNTTDLDLRRFLLGLGYPSRLPQTNRINDDDELAVPKQIYRGSCVCYNFQV